LTENAGFYAFLLRKKNYLWSETGTGELNRPLGAGGIKRTDGCWKFSKEFSSPTPSTRTLDDLETTV